MKHPATFLLLYASTIVCGQLLLSHTDLMHDRGTDLLGQLFGDGRAAVSAELLQRADLYYHGGLHEETAVDHENRDFAKNVSQIWDKEHKHSGSATHAHDQHAYDHDHDHDHDHEHDHDHAGHTHAKTAGTGLPAFISDPWKWLHGQVRPRGHKHLSGMRYEKEILPWIWAAVKADPHNIVAYENGVYWLHRLQQPQEALKLLQRGIEQNPESAALEFQRAIILRRDNEPEAYQSLLAAEAKWRRQVAAADIDDDHTLLGGRILVYRGILAENRGEFQVAAECYHEALPLLQVTANVRRRLADIKEVLEHDKPHNDQQQMDRG